MRKSLNGEERLVKCSIVLVAAGLNGHRPLVSSPPPGYLILIFLGKWERAKAPTLFFYANPAGSKASLPTSIHGRIAGCRFTDWPGLAREKESAG